MERGIVCEQVSMTYDGVSDTHVALRDVDLKIQPGEFISITGSSGCGKSTLLNIIAGFVKPTSGRVLVDGKEISGPGPDRGVVFQQYAVFPWMTVRENVEFGMTLAANRKSAAERKETAEHFIELVGLRDFASRYPKELSGGMKQRLAIARSYAVDPEVLLMDEPFGALDVQTRQFMQEALLNILQREKKTVIFITHGVEEAVFLSDRVVVMGARPGRIREIVSIPLSYPRTMAITSSAKFVELRASIEDVVRQDFLQQRAHSMGESKSR